MEINTDKIDNAVLALMHLELDHDGRTWKSFDWETLDRLYAKGLISNPKSKSKSVVLSDEGIKRSEQLFNELFGS